MLETLKALSDSTRLRLIGILAHGEFTVQELTAILGMGQSRISRHLKILTDAGVLSVKRQGTWGYYRMGDQNRVFRDFWPFMVDRLDALEGRRSDMEGLALVLDERRRRSRDFFDSHARQWDSLVREVLPTADYRAALLASIPECRRLVEIGVGTGGLLRDLKSRARQIVGVDHSLAMLEQAREKLLEPALEGVELRLGEMAHLPLCNGWAETALLNMVLHHSARPAEVLDELARVLVPGGILVLADLLRHEKEWARERMADQWLGFERDELFGWLAGADFDPVRFEAVTGDGNRLGVFILVARKRGN